MASHAKRKANDIHDGSSKRATSRKQWTVPRKNGDRGPPQSNAISPGDSGIWVTCNRGKEGKCMGEIRDLFSEYAELLYPAAIPQTSDDEESGDIESEIQAEVKEMRKSNTAQLFTNARVDVQCVLFIKTSPPIEPVAFVKKICEDAMTNTSLKRTRFARRLAPMTLIGRASTEGLEKVAREVLAPHFHQQPFEKRKFAIRPSFRNHNILSRDSVIKQIATIVGPGHEVDLKNYDLLIIVELYQNVCGISVVDASFERLKRYNIAEIFDPTPKEAPQIEDAAAAVKDDTNAND